MPRRSAATPHGSGAPHIADPDLYARGDPESAFSRLRALSPVRWFRYGDSGFWAVTRHADAVHVYRDPQTFSSQRGMMLASLSSGDPAAGKMLVVTDPPRHLGLRRTINNALSPRAVRQLEHTVRRVAQARVAEAVERGTCDFVATVAAPLPVAVVCQLMGIPERDWELMHRRTTRAFGFDDPAYSDPEVSGPELSGPATDGDSVGRHRSALATRLRAHAEIMVHYADLLDQRRAAPGADLVSVLLAGEVDGRPLTEEEVLLNCDNVVLGGNETTRHAAAGAVFAFASRPDQWARLRADRTLVAPAVEEILRWTTPAIHVLRVATRDAVIGGCPIRAGEAVAVWNASANRDESVFAAADTFDVGRSPNRHLTFGFGEHFCLGAAVARLELRVLLEVMLARIARLELAGTVQPLRSNFIRGYRRLPLRVHAKHRGSQPSGARPRPLTIGAAASHTPRGGSVGAPATHRGRSKNGVARMRIAQLAPPWLSVPPAQYGGTELVVSLLSDGLVERGHDVTLFATGDSKTKAKLEVVFEEALGLDYVFSLQHELLHAEPAIRRSDEFDLIHAHTSIPLLLAALTERPLVNTLHSGKTLGPLFSLLGTRVWFVAPSMSYRAILPGLHYAGVIPHGIDVAAYTFRAEKDDYVLFIGRAVPEKGLHLAIGAARAAGLPLVAVAVQRGLQRERVYWESEIEPRLGADVTLIDEVGFDEKVDLMSRARALLFPIDWEEPFGLVAVEAMACGTPVVATRRASTPELIQPGRTGFLVPVEEYVVGAAQVLTGRLDGIDARVCRAWVEERFSKERMVLGYERAYERILGGHPAGC